MCECLRSLLILFTLRSLASCEMDAFTEITDLLEKNVGVDKDLALLLDYDGTLTPIMSHPDLAIIPDETKNLLKKIAASKRVFTGIISGRKADNVKSMVGVDGILYAGSHGYEIIYPNGMRYHHEIPEKEKENMLKLQDTLNKNVVRDGAWVENKGEVLTFHYRETPENLRQELIEQAEKVIKSYGFKPSDALCAIEVQPGIQWHKGYAAEFIMESKYGKQWKKFANVIFAGDDVSDEKLIEMFKGKGTTFRVSSTENIRTVASMRLNSIQEVKIILKWIVQKFCA